MPLLRVSNTSKAEASDSEGCEGEIRLKGDKELYLVLKSEANKGTCEEEVRYDGGQIVIKIKAPNLSSFRASLNAWLRLYRALKGVKEWNFLEKQSTP